MFKRNFFSSFLGQSTIKAECASQSEQEAAEEFQKILESNNGQMPSDPEEMQALLAAARPKSKRNPPAFERILGGIRMSCKAHRPNNGLICEVPMPLGQHFMTNLSWKFSNTRPSEFETSIQIVGGSNNPMQDQDRTPFVAANQGSTGQLMFQGQYPLPYGATFNGMLMLDSEDPKMAQKVWGLQKNFDDCHLQYQNQAGQAHVLGFMHAITSNLTLGFNLTHIVQNGMNKFSYVGSYNYDKFKFFFQSIPLGQQEKFVMGVHGRHGKRLDTYAELKVDQSDQTEALVGFKSKFVNGEVRGNLSSSGQVQSVYRRFIKIFELELQSTMNIKQREKPVQFGVALSMRQM